MGVSMEHHLLVSLPVRLCRSHLRARPDNALEALNLTCTVDCSDSDARRAIVDLVELEGLGMSLIAKHHVTSQIHKISCEPVIGREEGQALGLRE
jgi:DNA polymerase III epsilon subunit-like protein